MVTTSDLLEIKKKERNRLDEQIKMLEQVRASEQGTTVSGEKKPSTLQMAESVLKNAGHKMHAMKIAEEIEKQFKVYVKPTSLGTMLYRAAIERKKTFKKEKDEENTYSLLEW